MMSRERRPLLVLSKLARAPEEGFELFWWREGNDEVDFVAQKGASLAAVEVKGGAESSQSGMAMFLSRHPEAKRIIVGGSAVGACGHSSSCGIDKLAGADSRLI